MLMPFKDLSDLMNWYQNHMGKLLDEETKERTSWLRYLTTTNTVLLGLLVGLGKISDTQSHTHLFYSLGVALLILSILFLSLRLYTTLYSIRKLKENLEKATTIHLQDLDRPRLLAVKDPVFLRFCETAGYICFVLALLSLLAFLLIPLFQNLQVS
jgi:hypothetical protein